MPQWFRIAALAAAPHTGAPRRRPLDRRRAALTLLLGAALLGAMGRPARASTFYEECTDTVERATQSCFDSSENFFGRAACSVMGGLGIIACAAAEAARQMIPNAM